MFDHVALGTADLDRSRAFYAELLGPPHAVAPDVVEWGTLDLSPAGAGRAVTTGLHLTLRAAGHAVLTDPDGNTVVTVPGGDGAITALEVRVADVAATRRFYDAIAPYAGLPVAGRVAADGPPRVRAVAYGPLRFVAARVPTTPFHPAFPAPGRATVDAFHAAALAAGATDNGPPGERPHYHPGYYGAFVLDPDGHNVEVVFHGGT